MDVVGEINVIRRVLSFYTSLADQIYQRAADEIKNVTLVLNPSV